ITVRRAQVQQVGNFAHGFERHAAQMIVHHMQRRQGHRLPVWIARQVSQDLLTQVIAEYAHRSSSAAMMFRLPNTATTSLIWCPTIRYGKIAKWMYDGGRVRQRHGRSVPSPTT